jgi:hypothetical protein
MLSPLRADIIEKPTRRRYDTEVQVLAVQEKPAVFLNLVLQYHLVAAVGVVTAASAVLFTVIESTTTEAWGVGSVVALMVTLVGIVFRTQQNQLKAQRVEMDRMARRIAHLESELDMRRGPFGLD